MCGRYALIDPDYLATRYSLEVALFQLTPNYNVAPGIEMPTISKQSPNQGVLRRWGLIPFWAKDPAIGRRLINARGETVAALPSFRKAIRSQRCIVPASGFYEWGHAHDRKTPYYFKPRQDQVFSLAGLYDEWNNAEGQPLRSFTIITTSANELVAECHNRMPVILSPADEERWLDGSTALDDILSLLRPFPAADMERYRVSTEVNNIRNNHPDLVKSV